MTEAHETTDPALVQAARSGSLEALGELYRRHHAMTHAVAYRLLGSSDDAQDVLQDVFVGLPRALRSYSEQGRFESWLKRLAVRTALMRLRSERRKREDPIETAAGVRAGSGSHPVLRLEAQRAIGRLPDALRAVFVLREVEGYSHDEIADMLQITAINSATRLSRAWSRLRKEIR